MTKKINVFLSIILALVISSASFNNIKAADVYKLGDLDDDGQVTATDARLCLRASAGLEKLTRQQEEAADIFGDVLISAAEARFILRVSASLETFDKNYLTNYPIKQIELIFPGKKIEFAEKQQINFSEGYMKNSGYTKSNIYIITSEKEFDSFINPNVDIKSGNYNELYFENKSIIAFFISHYSSSYETHVDSVKKENNEICIELITSVPASRAINTDYWLRYIFIEINNTDLLNITKFSYFEVLKKYK